MNAIHKLLLTFFLAALPISATACMCRGYSPEQFVESSDAIFTARRADSFIRVFSEGDSQRIGSGGSVTIRTGPIMTALTIIEVIKADEADMEAGDTVYVIEDMSTCMAGISSDVDFLIVGTRVLNKTFTTDSCQGSGELSTRSEMIESIREVMATQ